MIENKTVFILGAGASCPYDYPTGLQLRKEICNYFVRDSEHYFRSQGTRKPNLVGIHHKAQVFRDRFYSSSTKSIDLFLARHPEFVLMGKYAIIFRILAAERASTFREDMVKPEEDWYSYLYNRMTDDLFRPEDYNRFSQNDLSFVTFNYDRSLEHFLYESLLHSFGQVDAEKTKKQVSAHRIIHIFGQVAGLDWQDLNSKIEYKKNINQVDVNGLAANLRIIYEEGANPELVEAKELISGAERIFFLGFGYAKENLGILGVPDVLRKQQQIFGTALGLTDREIADVMVYFNISSNRLHLETVDCRALLRKHL